MTNHDRRSLTCLVRQGTCGLTSHCATGRDTYDNSGVCELWNVCVFMNAALCDACICVKVCVCACVKVCTFFLLGHYGKDSLTFDCNAVIDDAACTTFSFSFFTVCALCNYKSENKNSNATS